MASIVNFLLGVAVLLFGRRLFWLFVGVAGFIFGIRLATMYFAGQPDWLRVLIALGAGLLGALLAGLVQRLAIGLAGFVIGGYGLMSLLNSAGLNTDPWVWVLFVVGGIIGLVLILALLEPALVVLSSLAGAALLSDAVNFGSPLNFLLFVVLFVVGLIVQGRLLKR